MRAFDDWKEFYQRLERAFPRYPENVQLFFQFPEEEADDRAIEAAPKEQQALPVSSESKSRP